MWEFKDGYLIQNEYCREMKLDIEWICDNAGKRDKVWDGTGWVNELILSIPHMKRIMKYICQNCYDNDVLDQIHEYLKANNTKCFEAFSKYRK